MNSNGFKALLVAALVAIVPAAAQERRPPRLGSPEANVALERGINREALIQSFGVLGELSFRDLRRATLATLSAPAAPVRAMIVSPAAECQFTITKTHNPLPPSAGAAFMVTTRIENTGAACNQPNGVFFYDYQSQTNVAATSNYTPLALTQTPTAHFSLIEANATGLNQTTGYLNPWRVDVFQFTGAIPAGWVFQFERQLTAAAAPIAPNAVEWPNSPPITYSCMFGAHQLNFDIGAPSSATNSGGYDYKECGVAQVTTCIPIAQLPDLDAWWRFDDDSTDSVFGITFSGGTYVSGYVGQARTGTGSAPDHAALDLGQGDFTVDFWINVPSTYPTGQSDFYFRKRAQTSAPGYVFSDWVVDPVFQIADPSGYSNFQNTRDLIGQGWLFVAISVERDNPNGLTFYVRPGAPTFGPATILTGNPTGRSGSMDNTNALEFGPHPFLIDELEIFDRALTVEQLDQLYNAHHSGKCR